MEGRKLVRVGKLVEKDRLERRLVISVIVGLGSVLLGVLVLRCWRLLFLFGFGWQGGWEELGELPRDGGRRSGGVDGR